MIFFIVGFVASLTGAISGLGGGVIIKPVLDAVTDLDPAVIGFLSTSAVFSMSVAAVLKNGTAGLKTKNSPTALLGVGAALGGLAGTEVFQGLLRIAVSHKMVKGIQNIILFGLLILILIYINQKNKIQFCVTNRIFVFILGCLLGMISAFLGIGGGPVNMAALALFFSMDLKQAAANSIILILFSQAAKIITMLVENIIPGGVRPYMIICIVPAAIIGGLFGVAVRKRIGEGKLKGIYNAVMVFVILTCFWNILRVF